MRHGFTLLELLVVILIILLVSVLVLPTIVTSISERQIVGAASVLQAAIHGARDTAMRNGSPAGLRFLPDPALTTYLPSGQIDFTKAFASNRWVPLVSGPDYSEGLVYTFPPALPLPPPNPLPNPNPQLTPLYSATIKSSFLTTTGNFPLVLLQSPGYWDTSNNWVANNPTSWAWNIRVGDKVQLGSVGAWYTVCGPVVMGPSTSGNADLFVNYGSPGTQWPQLDYIAPNGAKHTDWPEYLLLVNGQDDNQDGYIDNGWDGVDNDGVNGIDDPGEWVENETWLGPLAGSTPYQGPYTIQRRLFPDPTARETALPSSVVLDLTTSFPPQFAFHTHERSRLYVNQYTGAVDLKVMPSGELRFDLPYGVPSSMTMDQSKVVFWLADRGDIYDPFPTPPAGCWIYLPTPAIPTVYPPTTSPTLPTLKGNIRILVADQWGRTTTVEPTSFDPTGTTPDPEAPYRSALQGQ
jgi:prepilin-type N-terminal cleavage/methylation domain-containing protein